MGLNFDGPLPEPKPPPQAQQVCKCVMCADPQPKPDMEAYKRMIASCDEDIQDCICKARTGPPEDMKLWGQVAEKMERVKQRLAREARNL